MQLRGAVSRSNAQSDQRVGFAGSSEQRYAIESKIASGGIATVYRGRGLGTLGFERPVAIKICHPHLVDGAGRMETFIDEARVAARIHHPNVVATLDVVQHDGAVMIVMEYVEGLTVAGLIRAAGRADSPVPVGIAARIVSDALSGLHAAHELRDDGGEQLGIVHRDVSPQNILVGVDGFAKLADFGVFKGTDRLAPSTEAGELKGKLGYVAPEVYRAGGEAVTRSADLYATGVVLWELLAGRRLWSEESHAAVMFQVLAGNVPSLAAIRPDVPPELDGVLARAFALDPRERYATAEAFAHALEPFSSHTPARLVAQHVRAAMEREPPPPAREVPTPHEYATPVVASAPKTATRTRIAIGASLGAALLAAYLVMPTHRSPVVARVTSATVPAIRPAIVAEPVSDSERRPTPAAPTVEASVVTPKPATPARVVGRVRASAAASASSAPTRGGRPLYDPEEL